MKPVGYLFSKTEGLEGEPGVFYDYIFARNGVFISAQNPLIKGVVCISPVEVRGLAAMEEKAELVHGKIPEYIYDLSLSTLATNSEREQYLAVTWENGYRLRIPTQEREAAQVRYERLPSSVMDIHSHGRGKAWFSLVDDGDEQGLRLYMVVGRLDTYLPEVELRLGVYGHFAPLSIEKVFDVSTLQRFYQ